MNSQHFGFLYKALKYCGICDFQDEHKTFHLTWHTIYCAVMLFCFGYIFVFCEIIQTFKILNQYNQLVSNLTFVFANIPAMIKVFIVIRNRKNIQDICRLLENESKMYTAQYHYKLSNIKAKIKFWCCLFVIGVCCVVVSGSISHNGSNNLPFEVYIPWSTEHPIGYKFAYAYQIMGVSFGGIYLFLPDMLLCFIIRLLESDLSVQLEILQKSFENIPKQVGMNLHTKIGLKRLTIRKWKQKIHKCINHYELILECTTKLEKICTYYFLVQMSFNLLNICIGFCGMATNDLGSFEFFKCLMYVCGISLELYFRCNSANELSNQAFKLGEAVYKSGWENFIKETWIYVQLVTLKSNKPIRLTAGKFVTLSLATFISVLKGGYSYYTVIKNK